MNNDFPRTLKIATVWLVVGVAVFLAVSFFEHRGRPKGFVAEGGVIEIRRGPDGHYHWPGEINGQPVDFLVDTGATRSAMPRAMARSQGLEVLGQVQSNTAGGMVTADLVRVELLLQGRPRLESLVIPALAGLDDLGRPLLGMDVLGQLHLQQRDGVLSIQSGGAR